MYTNKQLKVWKHLWDIFIADSEFRKYYTNVPAYDLTMNDRSPISTNKGTLYIPPKNKRDPEGHFIAYEKIGREIHIFDPSSYAYQQFQNNPELERLVSIRSGKTIRKLKLHPQDACPGDTFCQTWSLGWLKSNLRSNVITASESKNKQKTIESLYTLIRKISRSKLFINYMTYKPNIPGFNKLIIQAMKKFNLPKSTSKINDVKEFIHFSQNISLSDISRIMLNEI